VSSGKDVHNVVFNYVPTQHDELASTVGDKVIVKAQYDDGWAYGFNTRTMKEGFFPLGILSGFAPSGGSESLKGSSYGNRASSIFSPEEMPIMPSGLTSPISKPSNLAPTYQTPKALSPTPQAPPTTVNKGKVRIVMLDFEPAMSDEAGLKVGDQVQVEQEYDDGWGVGTNLNTGKSGVFPLDVLMCYGTIDEGGNNGDGRHSQRMSSLYESAAASGGNTGYYAQYAPNFPSQAQGNPFTDNEYKPSNIPQPGAGRR